MDHGSHTKSKPSWIIVLIVGVVFGVAIGRMASSHPSETMVSPRGASANADNGEVRYDDPVTYKVTLDGAPARGTGSPLVTVVEFTDFQCPYCGRAYNTVTQLEKEFQGRLRLVMKEFPLPFHPHAKPAALAALAAREQGKFWPMYDLLFTHQHNLEPADFESYARQLGMDVDRFKKDMADPKLAQELQHDLSQGEQLGVSGTPAFFINGRKFVGARPVEQFRAALNDQLAKAEALVKSGTGPNRVYEQLIAKGVTRAPARQPNRAPQGPVVKKIALVDQAPSFGPKHAKVTVVEWSDFQCPYCGRAAPAVEELRKTYGKDVHFVFRNLPLSIHQNARIAAQAAMAAFLQGKFWEMHDVLFEHQRELSKDKLFEYAKQIHLDMAKFERDFAGKEVADLIARDEHDAIPAGVHGTPTFYINGRQRVGAVPIEEWKSTISSETARADQLISKGVKLEQVYDKLTDEAANPPAPKIEIGEAPVWGPKNAPVTIVEWSDFQCPYCGKIFPVIKQIQKEYAGKVKIAFKNQPLSIHRYAHIAAEAAMAANAQGKFWDMHDLLFTHQSQLDRASLDGYAKQLHLDMAKFDGDMDQHRWNALLDRDSNDGNRVGATGTPTLFINGQEVRGYESFEQIKMVIDDALKKAPKVATAK